jgi:hypothetical protein
MFPPDAPDAPIHAGGTIGDVAMTVPIVDVVGLDFAVGGDSSD